MAQEIEISTQQLCEYTSKSVNRKFSTEQVATVWHQIGIVIRDQLLQRKAVRLTSFGTFSLSKGYPAFSLAGDMAKQFKLTYNSPLTLDNVPTSALNFAQIAANTNLARDLVEKIYSKFLTAIGRMIFEGRSILLTFSRVAEVAIQNYKVTCDFVPEFYQMFNIAHQQPPKTMSEYRAVAKKTTNLLTTQQQVLQRNERGFTDNMPTVQTGLMIGGESNDGFSKRASRPRSASAARARNPITGEGESASDLGRPQRGLMNARPQSAGPIGRGRNPNNFRRPDSAGTLSTSSLMHSPRSQYSGAERGGGFSNRRGAGPTNGQRQSTPGKRPLASPRPGSGSGRAVQRSNPEDARAIAAKALTTESVIDMVRQKIIERGGSTGIKAITRLLAIMDDNGDKKLSKEELKYGLRDYGIALSPMELDQVFYYFDRDGNGFVDVDEFLIGLKGEMNARRKDLVQRVFNILDKDRSGAISVDEILGCYDLTWHPEVRAGRMTVKEAAKDFMQQWEKGRNAVRDGTVTFEEFEEYYKEVSASIDDDDYFELMIRNAWRMAGGKGAAANTANRRVLVTKKDGSQEVRTIENELGMNTKDKGDIRRRLGGEDVEGIDLYGNVEDMKAAKRQRQPPQQQQSRPRNPGGNGARPVAASGRQPQRGSGGRREAWNEFSAAPDLGDQNLPPGFDDDNDYNYGRNQSNSNNYDRRPQSSATTVYDTLRRLFYSPPRSPEQFCAKLQVSSVTTSPRVPQGAFFKRVQQLDPNLTKEELLQIWKVLDPRNHGYIEVNETYELLSTRYGKDRSQKKETGVIERVIQKILERCGQNAGIKGLTRTLAIMDNSGDKKLSKEELKYGLQDYGIELNLRELDDIFFYFDRDKSGLIDIDEFLIGIKGDLNDRRRKFVQMAFNILDVDGSGEITIDEMMSKYDFKQHPDVVAGRKTIKQAAQEFMAHWEKDGNDLISYEEFEDYYKGISASIDNDDYFELMIRNAWRIAGGSGAAANTANRRVLVTKKDGSQEVRTIENELGMNAKDKGDIRRRLGGEDIEGIDLYGAGEEQKNDRYQPNRAKARTMQIENRFSNNNKTTGRAGVQPRAATPVNNRRQPQQQQRPINPNNRTAPAELVTAFDKYQAASKLAAAYRGRMARKQVSQEKRKVDAQRRQEMEEEEERNRPKPREILRPKGKSYIGF